MSTEMHIPSLDQVADLWEQDGSLRDVYFLDTTIQDWQTFLNLNISKNFRYTFDGNKAEISSAIDLLNNCDGSHTLSIETAGVEINCHFFCTEEIELDIDPRQVKGEREHIAVLEYIAQLAMALHKTAYMTPENSQSEPIFTFDPDKKEWKFHSPR